MKPVPQVFLCLVTLCGLTFPHINGEVVITVKEGSDVVIPCSLSSKENIESKLFDWKKDGDKEVFMYEGGLTYGNGRTGQDKQFVDRVSHFQDELKNGNASIKISKTKVSDSGNYTCIFPHLQPSQTFSIQLVVGAVVITVKEGSDVVLPCSLSSKENIESKLVDWKKDGAMEVFIYDGGLTYGNGFTGQDDQFEGRATHFDHELKNGNASIKITKTKVSDSGVYTCTFPRLQPRQTFHIQLVVGVSTKPSVMALNQTKDWTLLRCVVRGASPKPKVEWKDDSGDTLHAKEPKVTESRGKYDIILEATVTKTGIYRCVVTQEQIGRQGHNTITVYCGAKPSCRESLVSETGRSSNIILLRL
ncbi:CD276 antigen-like isoform X2 [Notolabrus celidotus]|uniref:CD276 antigen-like isoform X2 n=1 Tax=Notolabrus celidotus TaxID=1203425 RepID=UPI00148FBC52|nr:CD276 antigen-like isoform X2 [Notolabrus celidotus]